jgi:hypothetical protein
MREHRLNAQQAARLEPERREPYAIVLGPLGDLGGRCKAAIGGLTGG